MRIHPILLFLFVLSAIAPVMAGNPDRSVLRPDGVAENLGYTPGDTLMIIPAYVKEVPDHCFAGCPALRRVEFEPGSRCRSIGEYAFAECSRLEEISLPSGIAAIGEGAFRECRSLRRLSLPDGMREVERELCLRCVALSEVSFPQHLAKIGAMAFAGCDSLESVRFPASLTVIGNNAFSGCRSIEEVVLPTALRQLESYAFEGCRSLRRLVLPAAGNELGELIVADCPKLTEIEARSEVPPAFECGSSLFELDDTAASLRCTLIVPQGAEAAYRMAPGWKLLSKIRSAGIDIL